MDRSRLECRHFSNDRADAAACKPVFRCDKCGFAGVATKGTPSTFVQKSGKFSKVCGAPSRQLAEAMLKKACGQDCGTAIYEVEASLKAVTDQRSKVARAALKQALPNLDLVADGVQLLVRQYRKAPRQLASLILVANQVDTALRRAKQLKDELDITRCATAGIESGVLGILSDYRVAQVQLDSGLVEAAKVGSAGKVLLRKFRARRRPTRSLRQLGKKQKRFSRWLKSLGPLVARARLQKARDTLKETIDSNSLIPGMNRTPLPSLKSGKNFWSAPLQPGAILKTVINLPRGRGRYTFLFASPQDDEVVPEVSIRASSHKLLSNKSLGFRGSWDPVSLWIDQSKVTLIISIPKITDAKVVHIAFAVLFRGGCPSGQSPDPSTNQCKKSCPQGMSFRVVKGVRRCVCPRGQRWHRKTRRCVSDICARGTRFDASKGRCSCPQGKGWSESKRVCVTASCTGGTVFDGSADRCVCPRATPMYSRRTKRCEACPKRWRWRAALSRCVKDKPCVPGCRGHLECVNGVCVGRGALNFTLTWDVSGDLDLHVVTPRGSEIYFSNRTGDGGQLDHDDTTGTGPENIFWKSNAPKGTYRVCVNPYSLQNDTSFDVKVTGAGGLFKHFSGDRGSDDGKDGCSGASTILVGRIHVR